MTSTQDEQANRMADLMVECLPIALEGVERSALIATAEAILASLPAPDTATLEGIIHNSMVNDFAKRGEVQPLPDTAGEVVAVLRFAKGVPGNENEMPTVLSCNWRPDGDYPVFLAPQAPATGEVQAIIAWLKSGGHLPAMSAMTSVLVNAGRAIERGDHLATLTGGAEGEGKGLRPIPL